MTFGITTYGLALLAGILSILSPCVLPLVPILVGSAVLAHRFGAVALAAGLTLSFTIVGVVIAAAGASLGLNQEVLRNVAAVLLLGFGSILLVPALQERFAVATSGLSSSGNNMLSKVTLDGLPGQFVLGLLLGIVWSPCVGPTLGAAITLASQGQSLAQITLVMALFGLGASLPLIVLGLISRQAMSKVRGQLLEAGKRGKQVLGVAMLLIGIAIITGGDKAFETWILSVAPDWLVRLTTRF
jgi:cytochrome c biogenesis protein CcdA